MVICYMLMMFQAIAFTCFILDQEINSDGYTPADENGEIEDIGIRLHGGQLISRPLNIKVLSLKETFPQQFTQITFLKPTWATRIEQPVQLYNPLITISNNLSLQEQRMLDDDVDQDIAILVAANKALDKIDQILSTLQPV